MIGELSAAFGLIVLLAFLLLSLRAGIFRAVARLVRRAARILTWPIRKALRPIFRLRGRRAVVGPSAAAPIVMLFRSQSDTERALGDVAAVRSELEIKQSLGFGSISGTSKFIGLGDEVDDALLQTYFQRATEFWASKVPISANSDSLYEDVESAVIIDQWRDTDLKFFVIMDQMRKTVNQNVMWLASLFSWVIVACLVLIFVDSIRPFDFSWALNFKSLSGGTGLSRSAAALADLNRNTFTIITSVAAIAFMCGIYLVSFRYAQLSNFQEMRAFLSNYFAQMQIQFNYLNTLVIRTTNSAERDEAKLKNTTGVAGTTLFWFTLRPFFAESFLRGILYQIKRNSGMYVVFVPLLFVLITIVTFWGLDTVGLYTIETRHFFASAHFLIPVIVLSVFYFVFLFNSLRSIMEVDQDAYMGFDNWNLDSRIKQIFESYAERIARENATRR